MVLFFWMILLVAFFIVSAQNVGEISLVNESLSEGDSIDIEIT
jgi:hypothetical protein